LQNRHLMAAALMVSAQTGQVFVSSLKSNTRVFHEGVDYALVLAGDPNRAVRPMRVPPSS
jgi:hypothetical protein